MTTANKTTDARGWLVQRSDKLAQWIDPKESTLTPSQLINIAAKYVAENPEYNNPETIKSIYVALIAAAQLGLEPDTPAKEAYFVPFYDKVKKAHIVTLMPGFQGIIKLVLATGLITEIRSRVVYENEHFEADYGTHKYLEHKPKLCDPGKPVGVYSICRYASGDVDFEIAPWSDVEKVRVPNSPAWKTWPEEMAKKFAIKRHAKQLPMSQAAVRAISFDNELSAPSPRMIDVDPGPSPLASRLAARSKDREEEAPAVTVGTNATGANQEKPATKKATKKPASKSAVIGECALCGTEAELGKGNICALCSEAVEGEEATNP